MMLERLLIYLSFHVLVLYSIVERPIHPTYYEPGIATLHLNDDGTDTPNENNWNTTVPYWPHYNTRTVQILDGVWYFGVGGQNWTLNETIDPSKFESLTPNTTYVPSAYDVKLPGVEGYIGTAFYRTTFNSSIGKDIMVYFSACAWYCQLYFDGVYIGDHRATGYNAFGFYLNMSNSSYNIKSQTHQIFVVANNEFSPIYNPIYITSDFWFFAGINRNVLVHTLNSPNPSSNSLLRIDSFTNSTSQGTLDVNITFLSTFTSDDDIVSFMFVFDGNDNNAIYHNCTTTKDNQWVIFYNVKVPNFKLWSMDSPNLHTLDVRYIDSMQNKNVLDSIEIRFGLRILGIDRSNNNRLTINGKAIRLHGFNRHTMWPDTGSALTLSQIEQDVAIIKQVNANYIRGSQYTQDQRFVDICDEQGIVLWQEILGPGVNYTYLNNPYWMKINTQQINEQLDQCINNPSIIIYGMWNEGFTNTDLAIPGYNATANVYKARDRSRFITWASNKETEDVVIGKVADIISYNNYPAWYDEYGNISYCTYHWNEMAEYAKTNFPDKPFFISEYGAGAIYEFDNITDCKWSQLYQNEVLTADTRVAINNSWVSGVSIWILADFKSPDYIRCKECEYFPNSNPPTCEWINASDYRPGGLNHKGVVDYWRRYKQSFKTIQNFYYNDTV